MFGQFVSQEWQCKNHIKEQNGFHTRVAEWLLACHLNQKRHLSALVLLPSWPPSSWGSSSKACQHTVVKMAWILLECHHQNSRAEHGYKTVSQGKKLQSHVSASCRSKKYQKNQTHKAILCAKCDFPNTSAKQLPCKRLRRGLKHLDCWLDWSELSPELRRVGKSGLDFEDGMRRLVDLSFAGDIALFWTTCEETQHLLHEMLTRLGEVGLQTNYFGNASTNC